MGDGGGSRDRFSRFVILNKNVQEVPLPIKYKINRLPQKGHFLMPPILLSGHWLLG